MRRELYQIKFSLTRLQVGTATNENVKAIQKLRFMEL